MGHSSRTCHLSGLPITGGEPALLVLLKPSRHSKYIDKGYGSSIYVSNSGTRCLFDPIAFPVSGYYDDYGGLEGIIEDDNTKVLEEYFGLQIETIISVITSNRKDDGYDDILKVLMKDKGDNYKYGNPIYEEHYKELLCLSSMWVHKKFYDNLTANPTGEYFDKLDVGIPEILESLGFKFKSKDKKEERYNLIYEQGNVSLKTDGTWLKNSIYTLPDLKKYCKEFDLNLDISDIENKDRVEQIFDYIIPSLIKTYTSTVDLDLNNLSEDKIDKYLKYSENFGNRLYEIVKYILLNYDFNSNVKMYDKYMEAIINNANIREHAVKFWRFDHYMYSCGRYYQVIGCSPQDGDKKAASKVLKTAFDILNKNKELTK